MWFWGHILSNPKLSYSSKTPKQYDLRRRMVANVLQLLQSKQSSRFDHAMAISAGFFLAALRHKMYHTMCHSMCQSCNFIHDSQICFYKIFASKLLTLQICFMISYKHLGWYIVTCATCAQISTWPIGWYILYIGLLNTYAKSTNQYWLSIDISWPIFAIHKGPSYIGCHLGYPFS